MSKITSHLSPDLNLSNELILIAGSGVYPLQLAESARRQGVKRLVVIAFKKETDSALAAWADEIYWLNFGQLAATLEILANTQIKQAVMVGQIKPTNLFRLRPDRRALKILASLHTRNAHTIFGAVSVELQSIGVTLLPAYLFMEHAMPEPGQLSARLPTQRELSDIALGMQAAKATSKLDIGQTVVVKEGTILAVEAFEGTDEALLRAGKLGGPGSVIVKVAKQDHDMRFDIPVVGMRTIAVLKKIKASALALEARRTIILERDKLIKEADRVNLALVSVVGEDGTD